MDDAERAGRSDTARMENHRSTATATPVVPPLAATPLAAVARPARHPLRGALLFVLSLLLFACMDTTTKYLAAQYPVPLVVALRYIVHCALMLVLLLPHQGRQLVATQRTGWVLVRAACLAAASLFIGHALQRMPVAEMTAIVFLAPLLVVLVSGPVLGERAGGWHVVAAVTGFLGILLIARPGGSLDPLGIVYALAAAGVTVAYQLLSRILVRTERTIALLFHTALVGSVVFGLCLPWYLPDAPPPTAHLLLFLGIGAAGGLGHFLFTAAYRDATASLLAPMMYLQLVWAGLLGWLVFGHVPDGASLVGMVVVAASGAAVALRSQRS